MPEIITRAEAKARGLKRYFTGDQCARGHREERMVVNKQCVACRRIVYEPARKQRDQVRYREMDAMKSRRYRAKNPEKRADSIARCNAKARVRAALVADVIAVLREEMPELLEEFGL